MRQCTLRRRQVKRRIEMTDVCVWSGQTENIDSRLTMNISHLPYFTAPARALWDAIPEQHRCAIVAHVWCGRCKSGTTIIDYHGRVESGDLILEGYCKTCGGPVARVIEGR